MFPVVLCKQLFQTRGHLTQDKQNVSAKFSFSQKQASSHNEVKIFCNKVLQKSVSKSSLQCDVEVPYSQLQQDDEIQLQNENGVH